MKPKLHFLDRRRPILDHAVDFLKQGWTAGPLDLRRTLIIIPTTHAGRRLRERLAAVAAARGSAVLMGPVEMPAALFRPEPDPERPLASGVVAEAFWRRTLARFNPDQLSALGPSALADHPVAWASTAEHVCRLRAALCEEGFDLTSFAAGMIEERERWACLANLEKACGEAMRQDSWRDDVTEKLRAADHPRLPEGVSRIVVLFVPDPPPLALKALGRLAERVPVEICVHAHASEADLFDEWGRPRPEQWQDRALDLEASQVEVCDDAIAMTELIRRRILGMSESEWPSVTVGVGDRRTAVRLANILNREGVPAFDPAGQPVAGLPLFTLISRLFRFGKERTFLSFMNLARHPYALRRLEAEGQAGHELLERLDEFQNQRMPATFQDACERASHFAPAGGKDSLKKRKSGILAAALREAEHWLVLLDGPHGAGARDPLSKSLPATLGHIFRDSSADPVLRDSVDCLRRALESLARVESICGDREDQVDLFQRSLASEIVTVARPAQAVDLLGWLELAWEDAPVMLLADLNDGLIPETVNADPFLPDSARRERGLRDNRARLARDAHTLQTILNSRRAGNVRGFMPRRSPDGDPLKPSRLLLHCESGELAKRALYFFSDAPSPFPSATRGPGWTLRPPLPRPEDLPRAISVTGIRSYLDCPFGFYLERVLRLPDPYEDRAELDPRAFGELCHAVFKGFADHPVKDSADEREIREFLRRRTDKEFQERFGENLTLPLEIQRDIVRQRMSYAARVQARLRGEGWRIRETEKDFEIQIEGFPVRGRFDRVDLNERDGRRRILDYKTSAHAEEPEKAHRGRITARSAAPPYARTPDGQWAWRDLQLPLYVHAYRAANPSGGGPVEAAYFALPNAVADTDLLLWENMDQAIIESALGIAAGIIRRIQAGIFWPPNRKAYRAGDALYRLFFDDVERFLDPDFRTAMTRRAEDGGRR